MKCLALAITYGFSGLAQGQATISFAISTESMLRPERIALPSIAEAKTPEWCRSPLTLSIRRTPGHGGRNLGCRWEEGASAVDPHRWLGPFRALAALEDLTAALEAKIDGHDPQS